MLIVEDSRALQRSLGAGLTNLGFTVDQAYDGLEAEAYLISGSYDVILLDLMLPKMDGLEVLKRLRKRNDNVHVVILSAKDEIPDRTTGLDMGADDYLVKPFSFDELVSRLKAQYRRATDQSSPVQSLIMVGSLKIDTINRAVTFNESPVNLTPSEFKFLELLCSRRGQTFSHDQLIDRLYRANQDVTRNTIEAHVSTLRRKLTAAGANELILTRRGFGYYVS